MDSKNILLSQTNNVILMWQPRDEHATRYKTHPIVPHDIISSDEYPGSARIQELKALYIILLK